MGRSPLCVGQLFEPDRGDHYGDDHLNCYQPDDGHQRHRELCLLYQHINAESHICIELNSGGECSSRKFDDLNDYCDTEWWLYG